MSTCLFVLTDRCLIRSLEKYMLSLDPFAMNIIHGGIEEIGRICSKSKACFVCNHTYIRHLYRGNTKMFLEKLSDLKYDNFLLLCCMRTALLRDLLYKINPHGKISTTLSYEKEFMMMCDSFIKLYQGINNDVSPNIKRQLYIQPFTENIDALSVPIYNAHMAPYSPDHITLKATYLLLITFYNRVHPATLATNAKLCDEISSPAIPMITTVVTSSTDNILSTSTMNYKIDPILIPKYIEKANMYLDKTKSQITLHGDPYYNMKGYIMKLIGNILNPSTTMDSEINDSKLNTIIDVVLCKIKDSESNKEELDSEDAPDDDSKDDPEDDPEYNSDNDPELDSDDETQNGANRDIGKSMGMYIEELYT